LYFIIIYIFSNLAAFGVVDVLAASTGSEDIDDYKGLYHKNPMLSWVLAIALFSLAGIPPTAGFFGKFFLLSAAATRGNYIFLAFAALNMMISLYYYLRVVRSLFFDKTDNVPEKIQLHPSVQLGLLLCTLGILLTGFLGWLYDYIRVLA
jgi:NADH-quinone oxidoreductase subunit N